MNTPIMNAWEIAPREEKLSFLQFIYLTYLLPLIKDTKSETKPEVQSVTSELRKTFAQVIVANELGGNLSLAYKFSDPDGVRTGKSGWSFGRVQFDINNNPSSILALREMDFTADEISGLKAQTIQIEPMNSKLILHADVVDRWDGKQVVECLRVPLDLCKEIAVSFSCEETFLHIADYHNQIYMSRGGKLYNFLKGKKDVTPEMIRDFKLSLPWGKSHPQDVWRRYNNIVKAVRPQ